MSALVVERDYVLTHIIEVLAQLQPPPGLVFKGGTALRLCFYEDYRYSADLDFSLVGLTVEDGFELLREALEQCVEAVGLPRLALADVEPAEVEYVGPLGRVHTIKLDLAADERVLETTGRKVISRYSDQPEDGSTVTTYTLEEIAAEKLRCVIQRLLCRDLSDLHRLFVREGSRGRSGLALVRGEDPRQAPRPTAVRRTSGGPRAALSAKVAAGTRRPRAGSAPVRQAHPAAPPRVP